MTARDDDELNKQCNLFTRYLSGHAATDYVRAKYRQAHERTTEVRTETRFDRAILKATTVTPFMLPPADAFARIVAPRGALRKKLVLTLAILEICAPYYHALEDIPHPSRTLLALGITARSVRWAFHFTVGLLVFLPLRAVLGPPGGH